MISGLGIDLVELERIKVLLKRKPRFPQRILTEEERSIYHALSERRQVEFLAGRFAAKEALAKALGTGVGGRFSWQDVSILKEENGAPRLVWHKRPSAIGRDDVIHLSLSHSHRYALAQVVVEKRPSS